MHYQRLYTGTCVGQVMSYTEITVLIEDAFGNVIDSKIKVRKYSIQNKRDELRKRFQRGAKNKESQNLQVLS